MKELIYRGKDRYRPSVPVFGVLGIGLVVQGFFAYHKLGAVGFYWLTGVLTAALALGLGTAFRSWTRVGPAGITICWGVGWRGRTYPWRQIRWVDVRQTSNQYGSSRAARISLANGRRRTLPALRDTSQYPQPDFDAEFHKVLNWWKLSTDPAARFVPRTTLRSWLAPKMFAVIMVLLTAAGVVLLVAIQN